MDWRWVIAVVPLAALFFSYRWIVGPDMPSADAERGDTFFMALIGVALVASIWNLLQRRRYR